MNITLQYSDVISILINIHNRISIHIINVNALLPNYCKHSYNSPSKMKKMIAKSLDSLKTNSKMNKITTKKFVNQYSKTLQSLEWLEKKENLSRKRNMKECKKFTVFDWILSCHIYNEQFKISHVQTNHVHNIMFIRNTIHIARLFNPINSTYNHCSLLSNTHNPTYQHYIYEYSDNPTYQHYIYSNNHP